MKTLKVVVVLAALPLAAAAQDVSKIDPAHYKVLIDNASVRVLKVAVSPGSKTPIHSHPDAMLVSLQDSKAQFTLPDKTTVDSVIGKETAVYTPATTHASANVGTTPVDALLVEFKAKQPGTATLPSTREGLQLNVLAESPRAIAIQDDRGAGLPRGRGDDTRLRPGRDLARGQRHVARDRRQASRDPLAARHRAVHRPRGQARVEEHERPPDRVRDRRDPLTFPEGGKRPPRSH